MEAEETILLKSPRSPVLLEEIESKILRRNILEVLGVLNQNRYKNSTPSKLIAVTKTVSPQIIEMLKPLEILDIGENRVQTVLPKLKKISPDFRLHWIGRLQSNKVSDIIEVVCMIHSLDRESLAQEIDRRAGICERVVPSLVQVNIAREPQKAGVDVTEIRPFLRRMKKFPNIQISGLMAMMPLDADETALTTWFRGMRTLFDELREEAIEGIQMDELSMGMSNDYAIAAREGATMVRVGTALFHP